MAQLAMQRKRFIEASQLAGEKTENEEGEITGQDAKSGGASSSSGGQGKSSSPRKNTQGSDKLGEGSSKTEAEDPQTGSTMTEYTCCHCLLQTAATESRPIGLVTLIQSSSVLAHKHESTNHLVLPTTEEEEKEELPPSWSDSLGLQYDQLFQVLRKGNHFFCC